MFHARSPYVRKRAARLDNAKILEVNQRLKRGEGWVGYRYSKGSNGEKVPSKFLYYTFYQHSTQKFINSKTNDTEDAYRQLLDARKVTTEGVRLLPSEVSRIRYEDLRAILLDYYREHKPRSIRKRHSSETDSLGNKVTEEVLAGADKLDKLFKRMPITEVTALKIKDYVSGVGRKVMLIPRFAGNLAILDRPSLRPGLST